MTDDTDDKENDVQEEAPDEEPQEEPDLGDDDYVEVDPDVAAAVTGGGDTDQDEEDVQDSDQEKTDDGEGQDDDSIPSMAPSESGEDRVSPGDIYCNALGMTAAVGRERMGDLNGRDRRDVMEEYGDLARDLELDTYVDQLLAERSMDELTPGQALVVATSMYGAMVMMDDPTLAENIAAEVGS